MPKIIIELQDITAVQKVLHLLKDLKENRCGLKAIASALRRLLGEATINEEE